MLLVPITLVSSAARTAAGSGDWLDLSAISKHPLYTDYPPTLRFQVQVTAVSGTAPVLTVFIEDTVDGVPTNNNSIGVTAAISTVSRVVFNIGPRGDANPTNFAWPFNPSRVRARWTITGTNPSFTFDVKGVLI